VNAAPGASAFISDDDDALYRDLLASQCRKHGVAAPIA